MRIILFRNSIILLLLCYSFVAKAQESNWDNMLFVGNKVSWGKNRWKTTGELQFRLKDDMRSLDQWFIEGMSSYLRSEHWEFTLPLRLAIKPNYNEFRPGLGVLYKLYPKEKKNIQIAQQVLYQVDISPIEAQHGLRYVVFYNHKIGNLIPNGAAGVFYRWSEKFTGIQFIRFGAGISYILDNKHTLNFTYFVGMTDDGEMWNYQGIPFFQLVINLGQGYQHIPAKYINF